MRQFSQGQDQRMGQNRQYTKVSGQISQRNFIQTEVVALGSHDTDNEAKRLGQLRSRKYKIIRLKKYNKEVESGTGSGQEITVKLKVR